MSLYDCGYREDQPEHHIGCRYAEADNLRRALAQAERERDEARHRIAELEGLLAMRGES